MWNLIELTLLVGRMCPRAGTRELFILDGRVTHQREWVGPMELGDVEHLVTETLGLMGHFAVSKRIRGARGCLLPVVVLAVTSCTVPVRGVTGVMVTGDGSPMGIVKVCDGQLDGATLFEDLPRNDPPTLGSWIASEPVTDSATWPLTGSSDSWTATSTPERLTWGHTYVLFANSQDNSNSAEPVRFTVDDLRSLTTGSVRYSTHDGVRSAPVAQFLSTACAELAP